jgi:hypothetical protein
MGLLQPAKQQTCFAKIGIYGRAGSGKTFTASKLAIGLSKKLGSKKPVAFMDSETGSDYAIKHFKESGIELYVAKTRSFTSLIDIIKEAEGACDVLIIDSLTHVWNDLKDSYLKALNASLKKRGWNPRADLEFQDWAKIKSSWGAYTDLFLNSKLHIIACGRAGNEYDFEVNDRGKKVLTKGDSKFKAETEFGYEPSLVIEMVKTQKTDKKNRKIKSKYDHVALVEKDRNDELNGYEIVNPTFESFNTHWEFLRLSDSHVGVETNDSAAMFDGDGDDGYARARKEKALTLDEIQANLVFCWPGATVVEKSAKAEALNQVFGTTSWEKVKTMSLDELNCHNDVLCRMKRRFNAEIPVPKVRADIKLYVAELVRPPEPSEQGTLELTEEAAKGDGKFTEL